MAKDMITRHFEHPSGATATLEMPAGWSRSCYYILTSYAATKNKLKATGQQPDVDRRTFATPEEARQAAVARERLALANGWKPRMAANIDTSQSRQWSIHRPTGEKLDLSITEIRDTSEAVVAASPFRGGTIVRSKTIDFTAVGHSSLQPGDRFLIQQREMTRQNVLAAFLAERVASDHLLSGMVTVQIKATMTAIEPGESEAIENWHDREAILQAGIETDTSTVELWDWLRTRVSDASERQQVQAAIIRGRAERQARLAREAQDREIRERQRQQLEEDNARRATELQVRRPLLLPKQPDPVRVPGVDLSKPRKRKIDLGE